MSSPITKTSPRVSICLPNLNNRPFLPERIACIQAQTLKDYEVVISDNLSDDGAYELFQDYARDDKRVRLFQRPRQGMYANWNNCVKEAQGDWIYFATSDDSMTPDCLQSLVELGQSIPHCDLVTSAPWTMGASGDDQSRDWSDRLGRLLSGRRLSAGKLYGRRELLAGLLFGTPTLSMTQMVIRQPLFQRTGMLPLGYGSAGDFAWQMRAFAFGTAAYLPRKVGSWRQHPSQATSNNVQSGIDQRARILMEMWRADELPRGLDFELALGFALAWSTEPFPEGMPPKTKRVTRWLGHRRRSKLSTFLAVLLTRVAGLISRP